MVFNPTAATVFADGPALDPTHPDKAEIRRLLSQYESVMNAFTSGGGLIYISRSSLNGDLARPANTMAWVLGDSTVAFNGIYIKIGAAASGYWLRVADLPFSFILAFATPAGSPSAIKAISSIPVSQSTLVLLFVLATNDASPVTVSFNGTAAITVKSMSGHNVDIGGLVGGSVVAGVPYGTTFQLITEDAIASVVLQYRDEARAARDAALAAQSGSEDARDLSEQYALQSGEYAAQAQALVTAAEAGFTGFPSTAAYDFGFIADATTYFDQDWGGIA